MTLPTAELVANIFICSITLLFPLEVSAIDPSFNCTKADTKIEKMICSYLKLAEFDFISTREYAKALMKNIDPLRLTQLRDNWSDSHNICSNKPCPVAFYKSRLALLSSVADDRSSSKKKITKTIKQTNQSQFKLFKDTGWAVCYDLLAYYNKKRPPAESYGCEFQFDHNAPQLSWPQWHELKVEDHLKEIYAIESHLVYPQSLPNFDVWQNQFLADMRRGVTWQKKAEGKRVPVLFHPRLRQTKVRFQSERQLETVLGYTRNLMAEELCKENVKECLPLTKLKECNPAPVDDPGWLDKIGQCSRNYYQCAEQLEKKWGGLLWDAPGEHIVIFEPSTHKIRFIYGIGGSKTAGYLFIYRNNIYLSSVGLSGVSVGRFKTNPATMQQDKYIQDVCQIDVLPYSPQ